MENTVQKIREEARRLLSEGLVDVVIGFERGTLPLHSTPVFIRDAADVDRLVWDSFCGNNLATYLPKMGDQRVGVVAKGCDSRAIVALIVEKQIAREKLTIIGVPCHGVIDPHKVVKAVEGEILEAEERGEEIVVRGEGFEKILRREDYLSRACETCAHRNPVLYDVLIGEEVEEDASNRYADVEALEAKPLDERWAYFERQVSRCIRCYACREACPMCYCEECFVDHTRPRWIWPGVHPSDIQIWHIVRAYHQTGRCVECGACERACPMEIPLLYLTKKLCQEVEELYGFEAGMSLEELPPLATFSPEDEEGFIK